VRTMLAALAVLAGIALLAYSVATILKETTPSPTPSPTRTPPPQPTIALTPDTGYAGTYITIVGLGWSPGELVYIFLSPPLQRQEDYAYQSIQVGPDGTFIVAIVFPNDPTLLGRGIVAVVAQSQSKHEAEAPFVILRPTLIPPTPTVTPTLTPTPTPMPTPTPTAAPPTATATRAPVRQFFYWRGDYFANPYLSGEPVMVRDDENIDFNWGMGSPDPVVPVDNFSVRWTRVLRLAAGTYHFHVTCDDGARLWVDDDLVIDQWHDSAAVTYTADRYLPQGDHEIKLEYYEHLGTALVSLSWDYEDVFPNWKGEYFTNLTLAGTPYLVRNDEEVDFDWGYDAPAPGLDPNDFSVRWTRQWYFLAADYRFYALARDGVRVWFDDQLIIDEWHIGTDTTYAGDVHVSVEGLHTLRVEYYHQAGRAHVTVTWERPIVYADWKGEYFSNIDLRGQPVLVRDDTSINFEWGLGSPGPGMPVDDFSVRWTRDVSFQAGNYQFTAVVDDGIRVWIDSWLIIDQWHDGVRRTFTATFEGLNAGLHNIRVEYYEHLGEAAVQFSWAPVTTQQRGFLR
jgi:hypothetical protein